MKMNKWSYDESYQLMRLVVFLVKNGIMTRSKIAQVMGLSLVDFCEQYKDAFDE